MNERILQVIDFLGLNRRGGNPEFARKIGCSPQLVRDWLAGKADPGSDYRRKICDAYGISRDWLDTGNGPMLQKELDAIITESKAFFVPAETVEKEKQTREIEIENLRKELKRIERESALFEGQAQAYRQSHCDLADRVARQLERVEQLSFLPKEKGHKGPDLEEAAKEDVTGKKKNQNQGEK